MLPPLAAGAGAPAAFIEPGFVIDIAGAGLVFGVVDGVVGMFGLAGVGKFAALPAIPLEEGVGPVASTGALAPPAPAIALVFVFIEVAALGGIAPDELLSALHAQRLRAPMQIYTDERVQLLDFLIISVLQCLGRTRPSPTSSVRSASVGALSRC